MQPLLPQPRRADHRLQVVASRLPVEDGTDEVVGGDQLGGITGAARTDLRREIDAGHFAKRVEHIADAEAVPVAAIQTQLEQRLFKGSLISMGYGSHGAR